MPEHWKNEVRFPRSRLDPGEFLTYFRHILKGKNFLGRGCAMRQAVLVGPPNCGKSSLFRLLTGKHAQTGNRAGVTVDALSARVAGTDWLLTDLPGLRTLQPQSDDERVTVAHLREHAPDLVLAVCDATCLGEQYPLLCGMQNALFRSVPTVLVLTFCDELERAPSSGELSALSGLSVFPVSARSGDGIDRLRAVFSAGVPLPAVSGMRWDDPERLSDAVGPIKAHRRRTVAAWDRLLLRPATGIPLFFSLMALVLWLVFGPFGRFLSEGFSALCKAPLTALVCRLSIAEWLRSLLLEGILGGVGAIFDFFPRLLLLFLFQTFLEQSGYLSRAARLFDPFLRRFGLRGDAMAPLLLGFGCSVPAVLCTHGMRDPCARRRCACYLPVVACSARIPLCLTVSDAFFGGNGWWICGLLWIFSGMVFLMFCTLDAKMSRQTVSVCHTDTLPLLRLPSALDLVGAVCEQLVHFFTRAGGLILLTSVGVWLLSHFRPGQAGMVPIGESALALIGGWIAPLFRPLGLGDWRIASALLCGVGAKEATLSALGVLLGERATGGIGAALVGSGILNGRSALSFLVFYLFYFPCAATLTVQQPPRKWLFPLLFAYLVAFLIYRV